MSDCLFDLYTGYVRFKNPIVLAPMAGIVDSAFANQYASNAGLVVLGAFNLDKASIAVASKLAARETWPTQDKFIDSRLRPQRSSI